MTATVSPGLTGPVWTPPVPALLSKVFVTARSAAGVARSVAVAVLLPGFRSVLVVVIAASLEKNPPPGPAIVPSTVMSGAAPGATEASVQVSTPPVPGELQLHPDALTLGLRSFTGSGSLTTRPVAVPGPLFAVWIV